MNNEFIYYLHGTNISNNEIINIFDEGLKNYCGRKIEATAYDIKDYKTNCTLEEKIKGYAGIKGNKVIVIKIPRKYMYPNLCKKEFVPLPIWKKTDEKVYPTGSVYKLSPNFILGAYFKDKDTFVSNPKYSVIYNPSGLQYDDFQRNYLKNNGQLNMYNFMTKRNDYSYEELKKSDILFNTWDDAVNKYKLYFEKDKSKKRLMHNSCV